MSAGELANLMLAVHRVDGSDKGTRAGDIANSMDREKSVGDWLTNLDLVLWHFVGLVDVVVLLDEVAHSKQYA